MALVSRVTPVIAAAGLLAGCEELPTIHKPAGTYKPANVYRDGDTLPARVKRVAVLPMATAGTAPLLGSGVDALEPVFKSELGKRKRFELIEVSPEQLNLWTGHPVLRSDERLPRELFDRVHEMTGCDAVLFCQLTRYQPYQPLAIGWKMSLVEGMERVGNGLPGTQILWSVDENFDGGDPAVANAAQAYYTKYLRRESVSSESATILVSPARFGQYTLDAVLGTLPKR
jgi:hypothetical protein